MREVVEPVLKDIGLRRVPKTLASWQRDEGLGSVLLKFDVSSYGSAAQAGNTFNVELNLSGKDVGDWRFTQLSRCLLQAELDEWWEIQTLVNARRPLTSLTADWISANHDIAGRTRARYETPDRAQYREGYYVSFDYYSEEDILTFAALLKRHLPAAVERFATNTCPPPVFVMPGSHWP